MPVEYILTEKGRLMNRYRGRRERGPDTRRRNPANGGYGAMHRRHITPILNEDGEAIAERYSGPRPRPLIGNRRRRPHPNDRNESHERSLRLDSTRAKEFEELRAFGFESVLLEEDEEHGR